MAMRGVRDADVSSNDLLTLTILRNIIHEAFDGRAGLGIPGR